jgi:CheY-like chemotaxis protein
MTVFIGMVELALDGELNKDQRHYLETAKGAADTLLALINDLLDFSCIEAGKLKFRKAPFVVAESIERVAGWFTEKAHQKGLVLTFNISPSIPYKFVGDEQRMCQVLSNLLANAVKFTDCGKIEILADRAENRFDSSVVGMTITVRDTGIGIPPEKFGLLFQRFSQVNGSATRKYGGSGLGLVLSKSFVEDMGGILWVESEVGIGSAFSFWLPLETPDTRISIPASTAILADHDSKDLCPPLGRREERTVRILQAEDDAAIAELTQHLLQKKGWSVVTVPDGEKAFETFQKGCYDLVLMDVQMPGMDGLEATRRIREYEQSKGFNVPIIALTAHALEADRNGCIEAGMNDFLTKPIQNDSLYSCIEGYLYRPVEKQS